MRLRSLARLPELLATRAVDAGWMRGSTGFERFVVMGWYRTGSNLLLTLLGSDPSVIAYSELFSPHGIFWGGRLHAPPGDRGRLARRRIEDAPGFLDEVVFRPRPPGVRAVGFKLFYPQLVVKPVAGLAAALAAMPELRVIHLRRVDLLRVLVSNLLARRTRQMSATSEVEAREALRAAGRLRIPPSECSTYFTLLEERAALCAALFPREAVLDVTYEDLVADRDATVGSVRAFLGLPPRAATSPLVKQGPRRLEDVVENLDELRSHFRDSRWETFFEA